LRFISPHFPNHPFSPPPTDCRPTADTVRPSQTTAGHQSRPATKHTVDPRRTAPTTHLHLFRPTASRRDSLSDRQPQIWFSPKNPSRHLHLPPPYAGHKQRGPLSPTTTPGRPPFPNISTVCLSRRISLSLSLSLSLSRCFLGLCYFGF
jgi:hypothetical protein